jgi:hypothetical protein
MPRRARIYTRTTDQELRNSGQNSCQATDIETPGRPIARQSSSAFFADQAVPAFARLNLPQVDRTPRSRAPFSGLPIRDGLLTQGLPNSERRHCPTSGIRLILGSVKMSASSVLRVENSDTILPSGPAWNQWRVSGNSVYCAPGFRQISLKTV